MSGSAGPHDPQAGWTKPLRVGGRRFAQTGGAGELPAAGASRAHRFRKCSSTAQPVRRTAARVPETALIVVLVLNLALVAGLVAVGVTAHSLAVLAEGSDYLLDAAGVGVALLAIRLSERPPSRARPDGYPNATSFAALINAGWLLVLELIVAAAAADRLLNRTPAVHGLPVLVVSGIAALVMAAGALILRGDEDDSEDQAGERTDLSVAAVLLDTIADAAAAAAWPRRARSFSSLEAGTGSTPP